MTCTHISNHVRSVIRHWFLSTVLLGLWTPLTAETIFPGAGERTPSLSEYASWINNTNEGPTAEQVLTNLDFFAWLHEEYGMVLDIYNISAGTIDKAGRYGSMDSASFRRNFPEGFAPIYEKAKAMGTRLATWGGPDGFGNTPEEEQARIDMMVRLCRDYNFILLKFDSVVGPLRPEKREAFARMMTECRKHTPDLILLNHRLDLGDAAAHATTSLWRGEETYIDVHMPNRRTATHHRAEALARELVPGLKRLTEDHGVCISSCLDFWDDDLVLQAFNRNLILAPQIYGNPWLLRDDEYPKLARIFNLARQYREILVDGMVLPEASYGEKAVSRGDGQTRLITLRNISWQPVTRHIQLDESIGLRGSEPVELRQIHPTERVLGTFAPGETVAIEVSPFRACLLIASTRPSELGIEGTDYQIVRDLPEKPVVIKLLGLPGESRRIRLLPGEHRFSSATLDGEPVPGLLRGDALPIAFPGESLQAPWHRKLGELQAVPVPTDAEALYEATCFAADNNALEVRALQRSGPTEIPEVQEARDAFFQQPLFIERGVWDRQLFDGNDETAFYVARRCGVEPVRRGGLRIDLGEVTAIDRLVIRTGSHYALQPFAYDETIRASVSTDLSTWTPMQIKAEPEIIMDFPQGTAIRYVRFNGTPDRIVEIEGFCDGAALDRSTWRASHLFASYQRAPAVKAWQHSFTLDEIPEGAMLAVALDGEHGYEAAYAALRVDGQPVGAPDRSVSYPANSWEYPARRSTGDSTYYIPLRPDMAGVPLDVVVLGLRGGETEFTPTAWLTTRSTPWQDRTLVLEPYKK